MPTDLTIAEKAERLGMEPFGGRWKPKLVSGLQWPTYDDVDVALIYAERFPEPDATGPLTFSMSTGPLRFRLGRHPDGYIVEDADGRLLADTTKPAPDYRAALEGLVKADDQVDFADRRGWGLATAASNRSAALTHARKVLG